MHCSTLYIVAVHFTEQKNFTGMQCSALNTTHHFSALYYMFANTQCPFFRSTDSLQPFHIIKTGLLAAAPLLAREADQKYNNSPPCSCV